MTAAIAAPTTSGPGDLASMVPRSAPAATTTPATVRQAHPAHGTWPYASRSPVVATSAMAAKIRSGPTIQLTPGPLRSSANPPPGKPITVDPREATPAAGLARLIALEH